MKREELKEAFLKLGNKYGFGDEEFKQFENQLVMYLNCIKSIHDLDMVDYNEKGKYYEILIYTSKATMLYYFDIKNKTQYKLQNIINNAIHSFNVWGGEVKYQETKCEYDGEQIFVFQTDGTKENIFDALHYMRDYIMESMVGNTINWDANNVSRFEDYTKYIMPILKAIDLCEKKGTIYDVIREEYTNENEI